MNIHKNTGLHIVISAPIIEMCVVTLMEIIINIIIIIIIIFFFFSMKFNFHSVAVVFTLVETKQMRINVHKRNKTKT